MPYAETYFGNQHELSGLHLWKKIQVYKLDTFIRKCYGMPVIIEGADGDERQIECENIKQMEFFREQRRIIFNMFRRNGMHIEVTTGYTTDEEGHKWVFETMSYAGTYRLFANYKIHD